MNYKNYIWGICSAEEDIWCRCLYDDVDNNLYLFADRRNVEI